MCINQLDDETIKNLSQSELYILHYIYEHGQEVCDMSIQELAHAVSFSTATILRFCKKLNFSGFSEFKFAWKQQLKESAVPSAPSVPFSKRLSGFYDDIENTSLLIKDENLKKTIDIINSDKNIHLFGEGISRITINYLETLLFSIGRQKVYKYNSSRLASHTANRASDQDVLFAISTSGNFASTVKTVKHFSLNNAVVIAITPYTKNAIASLADINFRFFVNPRENAGAEYTSRIAIFYIIDIIFKSYVQDNKNKEELTDL